MVSKGCYRNKKFFLKQEAKILDQIEPETLRNKVFEIWPEKLPSQITNKDLKALISIKATHDPEIREWLKTLNLSYGIEEFKKNSAKE